MDVIERKYLKLEAENQKLKQELKQMKQRGTLDEQIKSPRVRLPIHQEVIY